LFTEEAARQLAELRKDRAQGKRYRAARKTLGLLEVNPRHPGLHTHEFKSLSKERGTKVFTAYAEQNTPAAYRVFFCYGPGKQEMTILAITPHP
jgi:hypothetical protein